MNNPSVIPAFDFREMVQAKTERSLPHPEKLPRISASVTAMCSGKSSRLKPIARMSLANAILRRLIISMSRVGTPDVQPDERWLDHGCDGVHRKAAAAIKESYISAFNWMSEQLSRRLALGEEMQHRYAIKETRSKLKGTIGSRLMNERKKRSAFLSSSTSTYCK
jgi:hypothetical protein